jgi:hypothetical protein
MASSVGLAGSIPGTVKIEGEDWPIDQNNWAELAAWKTRGLTSSTAAAIKEAYRQLAFGTESKSSTPDGAVSFGGALLNRVTAIPGKIADAFTPGRSVAFNNAKDFLGSVGDKIKDPLAAANRTVMIVAISAGVLGVAWIVSKFVRR